MTEGFFGSKGSGSSSFSQRPDTLRSNDAFEGILGVAVGPLKGLTKGLKSQKLNGTFVEDASGVLNFKNMIIEVKNGDPALFPQPIIPALGSGGVPTAVNISLTNTDVTGLVPGDWVTRTMGNLNADFIDLRFIVEQLYTQDKSGIRELTANLEIQLKPTGLTTWISPLLGTPTGTYNSNDGSLNEAENGTKIFLPQRKFAPDGSYLAESNNGYLAITGKTTSPYVKELRIRVPNQGSYLNKTWDIRVRLREPANIDADPNFTKRIVRWESVSGGYSTPMGTTEGWRGVASIRLYGKATDEFNGIPTLEGIWDTKIVSVPPISVYNPDTRQYTGAVWDGSFSKAFTTDPAWIINDVLADGLFGMSSLAPGSYLNKWDALEVSKWCSQLVWDGGAGTHPRYNLNFRSQAPQKANEFVQYLAGAIGGFAWDNGNGEWRIKLDKAEAPSDIVTLETIDGEFAYSHTDISTRYNDITGTFLNEDLDYREDRVSVVNDPAIALYGRKPTTVVLIGCTNRQEAIRRITLRLRASLNETKMVSFSTNRRGRLLTPFSTVLIADGDLGYQLPTGSVASTDLTPYNNRTTGRVVTMDPARTNITLRDSVRLELGVSYVLHFTIPNPNYNPTATSQPTDSTYDKPTLTTTRTISNSAGQRGDVSTLYLSVALPTGLPENLAVAIEAAGLPSIPKMYRVLGVNVDDQNPERHTISCIEVDTGKQAAADSASASIASYQAPTTVVPKPLAPSTGTVLTIRRITGTGPDIVNLQVNWQRPASLFLAGFRVQYRLNNGPLIVAVDGLQDTSFEFVNPPEGLYNVEICTRDRRGNYSAPLTATYNVTTNLGGLAGLSAATIGTNVRFTDGSIPTRAVLETSLGVAAAIAGQGSLATQSSATWGTQVVGTGKPADYATQGSNMLQNFGFDNGTVGWTLTSAATRYAMTSGDPGNYLRLALSGAVSGHAAYNGQLSLGPGTRKIYFSFWARQSVVGQAYSYLSANCFDTSGAYIGGVYDLNFSGIGTSSRSFPLGQDSYAAPLDNQWYLLTGSLDLPYGTASLGAIDLGANPSAGNYIDVTGLILSITEISVGRNLKVAGIDSGSTSSDNLLLNGNFIEGLNNWSITSGSPATTALVAGTATSPAKNYVRSTANGTLTQTNTPSVVGGRRIWYSGWVRAATAYANDFAIISPYFLDATGSYLGGGTDPTGQYHSSLANTWEFIKGSIVAPASAASMSFNALFYVNTAGGWVDFTGLRASYTEPGATFGATVATDLRFTDGSIPTRAVLETSQGTAAAIAGQGTGATASNLTQLNATEGGKLTGVETTSTRNTNERALNRNSAFTDGILGWNTAAGFFATPTSFAASANSIRGGNVASLGTNGGLQGEQIACTPGETLWIAYRFATLTNRTGGATPNWYMGIGWAPSVGASDNLASDVFANAPSSVADGVRSGVVPYVVPAGCYAARARFILDYTLAANGATGYVDYAEIHRDQPGSTLGATVATDLRFTDQSIPTRAVLETSLGTAAAITGQADWATYTGVAAPTMAGKAQFFNASGNLDTLQRITDRKLTLLFRADGSTGLTEAAAITSLGTAAAITGQGALATQNSAAWGTDLSGRPTLTQGDSLTEDAACADPSAWQNSYAFTFATVTDGKVARTVMRGTGGSTRNVRTVPIDQAKTYMLEGWYRSVGAATVVYGLVNLEDGSGTVIGGDGSFWLYTPAGESFTVASGWNYRSFVFGAGTSRPIPANARAMGTGYYPNYGGVAGASTEVQGLRIVEVTTVGGSLRRQDGTLATEGAIVTSLGTAAAITGQGNFATQSTATWTTQIVGTGKPSDNAGSVGALTEVTFSGATGTIVGNTVAKTSAAAGWNYGAIAGPLTGTAFISARPGNIGGSTGGVIGLGTSGGTDPLGPITWSLYWNGSIWLWQNNWNCVTAGGAAMGSSTSEVKITYDGTKITPFIDGVPVQYVTNGGTVAITAVTSTINSQAAGLTFYPRVAFYGQNWSMKEIVWGPWSENNFSTVGGTTKPQDNADVTLTHTAAAITGQGGLATKSTATFGTGDVTGFGSVAGQNDLRFGGSFLKDSTGVALGDLDVKNARTQGGVVVIDYPQGGNYNATAPVTGFVKITLPASGAAQNTLLKFDIGIYDHTSGGVAQYTVTGQVATGWQGGSCAAAYIGPDGLSRPVIFGQDATGVACVYIGAASTNWGYPNITVSNFRGGYIPGPASGWASGWGATVTTTGPTTTVTTISRPIAGQVRMGASGAVLDSAGTNMADADLKTVLGTAAAITGQGALATLASVAYGSSFVTGFGALAARANVALGDGYTFRADGTTALSDATVVTSLGTASAIAGQGALATLASVAYGSAYVTGFGAMAARTKVSLGDGFTFRADGSTALSDATVVTSLGVAASITGQAATATSADFSVVTGATKPANNATANATTQGLLSARPAGADGDFYFATNVYTLYQKIGGAWVVGPDITAANLPQVNGSTDWQTSADYLGVITTPLPRTRQYTSMAGGTDVSGTTSWTLAGGYDALGLSVNNTANSATRGLVTQALNQITASTTPSTGSGTASLTATFANGAVVTKSLVFTKNNAAAPVAGGVGATSAQITAFTIAAGGLTTTSAVVSAEVIVRSDSAGKLKFAIDVLFAGTGTPTNVSRYEYFNVAYATTAGGALTDVFADTVPISTADTYFAPDALWNGTGQVSLALIQYTMPAANTDYYFKVKGRRSTYTSNIDVININIKQV